MLLYHKQIHDPDVMCGAEVYMLPSVGVTGSEQPWPNPPREQTHSTVKMGLQMVELLIEWLPKLVFISGNIQECRWPGQAPQTDHGATERAETHPWQRLLFVEGVLGFDGRLPGAVSEKRAT